MTDDPTLIAVRAILRESLDELRRSVAALTAEQLNTRPAGEESNPLGVITMHALGSTRSWLALATGAPLPPRDRPAEFRTVVEDTNVFVAEVDAQAASILAAIDDAEPFDPSRTGVAHWRGGSEAEEPVTAAWALHHALVHLGEHVGHAQLTRQLFEG